MEKEKQAKKRNILKITKQVEEVAKDSYVELERQGIKLKQTKKDINEIGKQIKDIDKNLIEIQQNRERRRFWNSINLICCCLNCKNKAKQQPIEQKQLDDCKEIKIANLKNEEHLTPERIDKEWCMRYDPEDRWLKQVEIGLDHLLQLAEQMKKSFDEQNELAEKIYLDVKSNQTQMKDSRQKMQKIQETKLNNL